MVSTADVLCILLFVGLIILEGHRGVILAAVDFACLLVALLVIRQVYVPLGGYFGSVSISYLVLMGLAVLLTALLGIYLSNATNLEISGGEAAAGALLGLCSGLVLAFAFFEFIAIRYGSGAEMLTGSLLHSQLYELRGVKALARILRTLTGS